MSQSSSRPPVLSFSSLTTIIAMPLTHISQGGKSHFTETLFTKFIITIKKKNNNFQSSSNLICQHLFVFLLFFVTIRPLFVSFENFFPLYNHSMLEFLRCSSLPCGKWSLWFLYLQLPSSYSQTCIPSPDFFPVITNYFFYILPPLICLKEPSKRHVPNLKTHCFLFHFCSSSSVLCHSQW